MWFVRGWNMVTPRTTADILQTLTRHESALRALGVQRLALFGSAARGELRESSDLDFVVEFERKSFDAYMDLKAFLEELFGRRVDLVIADAIKPRLRAAILGEAVHAPGL
jgi:predicted nucleotidyltransferase